MSRHLVGPAFAVPISHRFYANTLELALRLQGQYNKLLIMNMSMSLVGAEFAVPISHRFYANALELALQLQSQNLKNYVNALRDCKLFIFYQRRIYIIESSNTSFFVENYCLNSPFLH